MTVPVDKRPVVLMRLPDARYMAVDRRQRPRCVLTRPFGHSKIYSELPHGTWRCRACGALGHYDTLGYM